MKLAIITQRLDHSGGLEGYVWRLADALHRAGHEIQFVIGNQPTPKTLAACSAPVHIVPTSRYDSCIALAQFAVRAPALVATLDCDLSLGFGRTTRQDIHRAGGGCHAVYQRELSAWKRRSGKNILELELEHRLYTDGETRQFVVNSQMVREQIIESYAVPENKIEIIHTAVDSQQFCPATDSQKRESLRQSLGLDTGEKCFVFISLNHKRKGLDALLRAWSGVDARLWIIGAELSGHYRRLIHNDRLGGKVSYLGRQTDLVPYLQAADFFIHPTLYDACANTVLQAMACGLPSLVSVADGAREFIDEGKNGWLLQQPSDADALAESAKTSLATNDDELEKMGSSARLRSLLLTEKNHIAGWEKLFQKLSG